MQPRVRIPAQFDRYAATFDVPEPLASAVRSLFIDQICSTSGPHGAEIRVDIDPDRVTVDGRLWRRAESASVLDELVYVTLQAALEDDVDRLHLHAGLVVHGGRSTVLGGVSGCGKSTLIAELVEHGAGYGTDERVAVSHDGFVTVFQKPISVVAGSFSLLERFGPERTQRGARSSKVLHIPASAIREGAPLHDVPPVGAVVLVEYRSGSRTLWSLLHPATVAHVLLADSIDKDRMGAAGPLIVASLCAAVPCLSFVHGGGPDVPHDFFEAVRSAQESWSSWGAVERVHGGTHHVQRALTRASSDAVLGRASGLVGAVIGDRALLRTVAGQVVELDAAQTAWMQLVDESASLGALVAEVALANSLTPSQLWPTASKVVDELIRLEVIA